MARRKKDSFSVNRRHGKSASLRMRRLAWWGAGTAASLLLLTALGYGQLLSYLQGNSFKASLEKTLCNRGQAASVSLAGPLGLEANRLTLPGVEASRAGLLSRVQASRIRAELNRPALWDRQLHLTRLTLQEATLTLDATRIGEPLPPIRKEAAGFLASLAPTSARLDRVECPSLDTELRLGGRRVKLLGSALTAHPAPQHGEGTWELRLNNGRLHAGASLLGEAPLNSATLTLGPRLISLSQGRLMLSPGELIANAAYEQESELWSADLRVNRADMARLLNADWKKRLTGRFYGRMELSGDKDGLQSAQGSLSVQEGVLEALPFLSELSIDGTRPYRTLRLEKATARLNYPYSDTSRNIRRAWMLDQLDIRAAGGLLRVQGHAVVDEDGSLAGTLLIGLPQKTVSAILPPGSELIGNIFNATGEEGYHWLRMNLSGTLDAPQEDLSVRLHTLFGGLQEAAGTFLGALFGKAGSTPAPRPQEKEEEEGDGQLPTEPASLLQGAGEAAQEAIGSGLRAFF